MENSKPVFKSKTIWGVVATVLIAVASSAWKGYRESGEWQGALDNALPALVTLLPAGYAGYGRVVANQEVKIK